MVYKNYHTVIKINYTLKCTIISIVYIIYRNNFRYYIIYRVKLCEEYYLIENLQNYILFIKYYKTYNFITHKSCLIIKSPIKLIYNIYNIRLEEPKRTQFGSEQVESKEPKSEIGSFPKMRKTSIWAYG